MPIYEYVCEDCGKELEVMQKMSESPLVECPSCSKKTLRKKISAPGFRLKGAGWYETDFKAGSKKNIAGEGSGGNSGSGGSSNSGGSSSGTSESKPSTEKPTSAPSSSEKS